MTQQDRPVWLITGCSTGFGRALAKAVLAHGYRAAVTARDPEQVADIANGHTDRALVAQLDVTDRRQVTETVRQVEAAFQEASMFWSTTPGSAISVQSRRARKRRCAECSKSISLVLRR